MANQIQKAEVKKGFTLIKLLVVAAIIAIPAAILFLVFSRARESARRASCMDLSRRMTPSAPGYVTDPTYHNLLKRHLEGAKFVFADGHVKWLKQTHWQMWTLADD